MAVYRTIDLSCFDVWLVVHSVPRSFVVDKHVGVVAVYLDGPGLSRARGWLFASLLRNVSVGEETRFILNLAGGGAIALEKDEL